MRIHGSKGDVMLDPTGAEATVRVASLNEWSLDMARDTVDVTCFQDPNKVYVLGLKDIKGALGGFYDNTDLTLFEAADGDVPAMLKLIPNTLAPTFFWSGLAYLDASVEVTATGAVTVASNFVAAGPWTREPVGVARRTPPALPPLVTPPTIEAGLPKAA